MKEINESIIEMRQLRKFSQYEVALDRAEFIITELLKLIPTEEYTNPNKDFSGEV